MTIVAFFWERKLKLQSLGTFNSLPMPLQHWINEAGKQIFDDPHKRGRTVSNRNFRLFSSDHNQVSANFNIHKPKVST